MVTAILYLFRAGEKTLSIFSRGCCNQFVFCCAKQLKWRSQGRRGQIACASPPRTELVAGRDVNSADLDATPKKQIVKNDFPGELDCRWLLLPSQTVTSGGVVFPGQPRPPWPLGQTRNPLNQMLNLHQIEPGFLL